MAVGHYKAEVESNEVINAKIRLTKVKLLQPETLDFSAGQLISLRVGGNLRRQYSIASSPAQKDVLDFYVDIAPGGVGSKQFDAAKPGDIFEFLAPLGRFIYHPPVNPQAPVVFLATGTGIAPFLGMLKQQLSLQKDNRPFYLFWGLRFEEDVYLREELANLERDYSNFDYKICLSQPSEDWPGAKGYCTKNLSTHWSQIAHIQDAHFYLCGAGRMIADGVMQLREQQIPEQQIFFEKFY